MTATPRHHPQPECLLAYANGSIGEAESLFIATHLAFCPECRDTVHLGECVGSQMLCGGGAMAVSSACRDKIFSALAETLPLEEPATATEATPQCFIPEPLRGYLAGVGCREGLQQLAWETAAPGQREYLIPLSACCLRRGAVARLVLLQPQHKFLLRPTPQKPVLQILCGELRTQDEIYTVGDVLCGAMPELQSADSTCYLLLLLNPPPAPWREWFKRLFASSR